MWAEVIHDIFRPVWKKLPHHVLRSPFLLVIGWKWKTPKRWGSQKTERTWVPESLHGRQLPDHPVEIYVSEKDILTVLPHWDLRVCQVQWSALPFTMHNAFLILFLYLRIFNFLFSIALLCVWKRQETSRSEFTMPCGPDFRSFTSNQLHIQLSAADQDKDQSYGNVK